MAVPDGFYLLMRHQKSQGYIEDRFVPLEPVHGVHPFDMPSVRQFRGWLKGFGMGTKRFLLCAAYPGGPLRRMTFQSASREFWQMDAMESAARDSSAGASVDVTRAEFREDLIREIESRILRYHYKKREDPGEELWPSSGEEPEQITPLPPLLRGGGEGSGDSDPGPRGPKIVSHEVLTGSARVVVKRLEMATERESARDVEVVEEEISDDPSPYVPKSNVCDDEIDDTSEEERARGRAGPSKPLKRARGRPRKDGSGPFTLPTPTIAQEVERALEGEIPPP